MRSEFDALVRQTHLWSQYERDLFTPGGPEQLRVVTLPGPTHLRVGVLICYDLEFPEPARVLAVQGAQLLVVPTALVIGKPQRASTRRRSVDAVK